MPNYEIPRLFEQGIYSLDQGVRVFAGTTDDAFFIDLGAAFDSLNFRAAAGGGVLSPSQDADDATNFVPDDVSGFNVNTHRAPRCRSALLTRDGSRPLRTTPRPRSAPTAPPRAAVRRARARRADVDCRRPWRQVQRMGNPLFNELIIGTGFKDLLSLQRAQERRAVRRLRPRPADRARGSGGLGHPGSRPRRAPTCCRWSPTRRRSPPPARRPGPVADLLRLNTASRPRRWSPAPPRPARPVGGDPATGRLPQRPPARRRRHRHRLRVVGGVLVDPASTSRHR